MMQSTGWNLQAAGKIATILVAAVVLGACTDSRDPAATDATPGPAAAPAADTADLILYNGHVITVDEDFSQAQAVAIAGGNVLAVGSDETVVALQAEHTRMVDLAGATVLPGMNDAHIHLGMWALSLNEVDLRGKSIAEVQSSLRQYAEKIPPGDVIRGMGWSEASLGRLPTRDDIDALTPDNPVVFQEMGHAYWVNSKMLELAGIAEDTQAPEGVKFERDPDTGRLTGVLHEARELILPFIPEASAQSKKQALLAGLELLNAQGVTSITVPGVTGADVALYQQLAQEDLLSARVALHVLTGRSLAEAQEILAAMDTRFVGEGTRQGMLTMRGVKLLMDGAPPGRTAFMFDDYPCCPGERGLLLYKGQTEEQQIAEVTETIRWLHRQGYQMGIHADGDRSTHIAINALTEAMTEDPVGSVPPRQNALRHYMIHGDLITDDDIARMADWNIGLTVQPVITHAAGELLLDVWGQERGERHMATGLFVNNGVWTSISTDAPIVPPDWKLNIEYAVLRENQGAPGKANGPEEYRVTVEQAIIAQTRTPAYQDFEEQRKGSIEAGKFADLVVVDRDILAIDPHEISDLKTLMTIVDGAVVYESGELAPNP